MGKLLEQRNRALDDINAGRTVKKIRDLESRVRELEEENESLKRDAERYRYLRNDGEGFDISVLERDTEDGELWVHGYPPEELDESIDAAMAQVREGGGLR